MIFGPDFILFLVILFLALIGIIAVGSLLLCLLSKFLKPSA